MAIVHLEVQVSQRLFDKQVTVASVSVAPTDLVSAALTRVVEAARAATGGAALGDVVVCRLDDTLGELGGSNMVCRPSNGATSPGSRPTQSRRRRRAMRLPAVGGVAGLRIDRLLCYDGGGCGAACCWR